MKLPILISSQIAVVGLVLFLLFLIWTGSERSDAEFSPEQERVVVYRYNWGEVSAQDADLVWQEIRRRLGDRLDIELHVETIPGTEYGQKLTVDLSIGEQIDGFLIGENDLGFWYSRGGIIEPLNYLLDRYGENVLRAVPEEAWSQVSMEETILGIPSIGDPGGNCIVVRMDILQRYGIELPETLEELEAAAALLLEKDPSIIPITGAWWDFSYLLCPALGIPRWDEHVIDHQREMIYTGNKSPEFRQYFATIQKWLELGYLDPDYLSANFDSTKKMFIDGKTVFSFNHVERTHDWAADLADEHPQAYVDVIPELNAAGIWSGSGIVPSVLLIPQSSQRKASLLEYIDWLFADRANYRLAAMGIPDRHYTPDGPEAFIQHETVVYSRLFAPLFHRDYALTCSNRFPAWYPAIEKVNSVQWHSDPLKGLIFLDTSISKEFPATSLFDQESGKFLDGRLAPTEENYQNILAVYFDNGGTEIARDYYRQYMAALSEEPGQ